MRTMLVPVAHFRFVYGRHMNDDNGTERAVRGVVVRRKNHYGSKSRRDTEVAALFCSLVESAKLAGVDPRACLRAAATAALRGERVPLPHEMAVAA